MGRPRKTDEQGAASAASAPAPQAGPKSVLAASFDPADSSVNFNTDAPVYASPKAAPHGVAVPFHQYYGEMKQHQEGQVGEPRPMFGFSAKE